MRHAMIAAGRSRLMLGQDLRLLEATQGKVWLEGPVRLRPGQPIELAGRWPGISVEASRARVITWRIVRITGEGPFYRGCCRLEV